MKLNLGCGNFPREGWVNIDRSEGTTASPCRPDVIADIRSLPFEDASADAVYCGHVLEHLSIDDVTVALQEVCRVLKDDGRCVIVGPDFDRATNDFPEMCEAIWPGPFEGEWEGETHQWCATATNTLELVRQTFPEAKEVILSKLTGWPVVSFVEWQFAIEAR